MITTEQVWGELSERLRGLFARRVRDPHAADDLLQETFVRIHAGLDQLQSADRLGAWVFQVARNVLADHGRAARAGELPAPEELAASEAGEEEGLNRLVEGWLAGMVEQLPEDYSEAVALSGGADEDGEPSES